jgi:hypothetical protein
MPQTYSVASRKAEPVRGNPLLTAAAGVIARAARPVSSCM